MKRDREQFWLIAACVIAAHAVALAAMTLTWGFGSGRGRAAKEAIVVSLADPIVRLEAVPSAEPDMLGKTAGTGDANETVELPRTSVSDTPDEVEQAWTRKQPVPLPRQAAANRDDAAIASEAPPASLGPMSVTAMSPLAVRQPKQREDEAPNEPPAAPQSPAAPSEAKAEPAKPPAEATEVSNAQPEPATANENESDAFAREEGVEFSPGGTVARRGREVKLKRPRVDLGFMAEATRISGRDLIVRLAIETDAVGNPSRVSILETSGSEVIDDAVRLAMYDSWFGGEMPDRFVFRVAFVRH